MGRSRALVPTVDTCPRGHGPLRAMVETQEALFRHGGYGAARRTTRLSCSTCEEGRTVEVIEINPRWL